MKKPLCCFLLCLFSIQTIACTTFFINRDGKMVFGRNYDWITGSGMVCTNQRGLAKTSDPTKDGETISWISRYGSITFNQYGKEFPTGGMNEKGLVVELMWLDGTEYPKPDKRPSVGVLQWIQYQLDNCSSVEELIATDNTLRIASQGNAPLHYLVADAAGNAATIEFLDGKMKVHKGKDLPFPVLTNDSYATSLKQTKAATGTGSNRYSFTSNSIERFAKTCDRVQDFVTGKKDQPVIDYSFSILSEVAQGSHTKWSIVYDIAERKIYFRTLGFTEIKSIAFSELDLRCTVSSKVWDMNQPGKGNIGAFLLDYTAALNEKIVSRSIEESRSQVNISDASRTGILMYPLGINCKKP